METIVKSLPLAKIPKSPTCSASHSSLFFHLNASSVAYSSVNCHSLKCFLTRLPSVRPKAKEKNLGAVVHASEAESPSTDSAERWLLEPVGFGTIRQNFFVGFLLLTATSGINALYLSTMAGKTISPAQLDNHKLQYLTQKLHTKILTFGDGDTRHLGLKVERPGAYEIVSSEVTVGRVPEKVDLVIPVATVSGLHARIQKKEGNLLVTDLDSTNGTFIDGQRLRPGKVATIPPGSCITFGDTHLAMFRVSKVENAEAAGKLKETEAAVDSLNKPENIETT